MSEIYCNIYYAQFELRLGMYENSLLICMTLITIGNFKQLSVLNVIKIGLAAIYYFHTAKRVTLKKKSL